MELIKYILMTLGGVTLLYFVLRLKIFKHLGLIYFQKLDVSFLELILMYLRNINVDLLLSLLVLCDKSKIYVEKTVIEAYILAEIDVKTAILGMIYAKKNGLELGIEVAADCIINDKNIVDSIKKWQEKNPEEIKVDKL